MFLKPQGYGETTDPSLPSPERHDTFTCKHCMRIVVVKPRCAPEDLGGICKGCMGLICPACYARRMAGEGCDHWEKAFERMEARARFLKSVGLE